MLALGKRQWKEGIKQNRKREKTLQLRGAK